MAMHRFAHHRMKRAVSASIDGELGPERAAAVEAHVRRCWACSGEAELWRLVKRSLQQLGDRERDDVTTTRLRRFAVRVPPGRGR